MLAFMKRGLKSLSTEQLLYEATTLLNAAGLINRIARQSKLSAPLGWTEKQATGPAGCSLNRWMLQKSNYLAQI